MEARFIFPCSQTRRNSTAWSSLAAGREAHGCQVYTSLFPNNAETLFPGAVWLQHLAPSILTHSSINFAEAVSFQPLPRLHGNPIVIAQQSRPNLTRSSTKYVETDTHPRPFPPWDSHPIAFLPFCLHSISPSQFSPSTLWALRIRTWAVRFGACVFTGGDILPVLSL